ncbi:putative sulfate exporter family transporter [Nocardia nepalensis]|uniref:putative sulfate exporter family transporter n=1 Tax=Nocardia nepalensis TaxID=3375448 RepID=UPI003B67C134
MASRGEPALVVVVGTMFIAVLRPAAHALGMTEHASGVRAGAAIHEITQVVTLTGALITA